MQLFSHLTVIVDEIGNADAKKGRIEPGVKTGDAFSLDDPAYGIVCGGVSSFGLDLCAGR